MSCQSNEQSAAESTTAEAASSTGPLFDWQAHRGGRGLYPENSLFAFMNVLEFPQVQTLELDLVVSKDEFLVVSHEPWMSATICNTPEGGAITEEESKKYNIYEMPYLDIFGFDCGTKNNPRFPNQKKIKAPKPRFGDVVIGVQNKLKAFGRTTIQYNIEMKSTPEGDRIFHPTPEKFAELVLKEINQYNIKQFVTVQSFDPRCLEAIHQLDSAVTTALLVGQTESKGLAADLATLSFTPQIYSPEHTLVNADLVKAAHQKGIRVVPWTVNDVVKMQELLDAGVDGIITDYPDRIKEVGKG